MKMQTNRSNKRVAILVPGRQKEEDMEVVGYECYANGTIRLKIMPVKESKRSKRREEQFYGCCVHTPEKRSFAGKDGNAFSKSR